MYDVKLTESYFPTQKDTPFLATTIGALLRKQAQAFGDRPALKEVHMDGQIGRIWNYQKLLGDSEKWGRALAARHPKGARLAVFAHNIPEWILMEYASALSGMVLVTVNPSFQARELKYVLEQSGAEAIYYVDSVRGNPLGDIVEAACADIAAVKHRIALTDHAAMQAGHETGTLPSTSPENIAQIQYTSGTTGFPKGALLHHQGLVQVAYDAYRRAGIQPGQSSIMSLPLFHTSGCGLGVLGNLTMGNTILLPPVFDPALVCQLIEREKLRTYSGVPTMLVAVMGTAAKTGIDISSVQSMLSGGSMVAPELARQASEQVGCPIQILYGQTESSPMISQTYGDDSFRDLTETIGQPMPHIEVSIRNTSDNSVCPLDTQGEICVRGYNVMHGYNDNPEATAKAIDIDGWLHTGDLGQMDGRGYMTITGRVKDMIIRGGENIFPVEIENAMLEHPDITEIAVVGIPDPKWGEIIACFMRSETDVSHGAETLKAFVRDRLSPQKTPAHWIWVDEWPLTGSGKIQKFKLRDQFIDGKFGLSSV